MMRIMVLLVLAGCLVTAASAQAMMAYVSEQELVAMSDLIIVGTVQQAGEVPDVPSWFAGLAVIKVNQVVKGPQVETVTVRHAVPPKAPPGMVIMDHGGITLQPKQQNLFFLARTQGGYTFTGGQQGIREAGETQKFAALAKAPAVEVTVVGPVGPFYFARPTPVSVKIKNLGKEPLQCFNPTLEAFFYAPRMDRFITMTVTRPPAPDAERAPREGGVIGLAGTADPGPISVAPGAEVTVPLTVTIAMPPSWAIFTPDTYLQSPASARARVFIQPPTPAGTNAQPRGFNAASGWTNVMVGFPPPDEIAPGA